jgi:hypothetical protein
MTKTYFINPSKTIPMEVDLKLSSVEDISNQLLDHTQIFILSLDVKPYFIDPSNEDDLQWKMTSKYYKWNISTTLYGDMIY